MKIAVRNILLFTALMFLMNSVFGSTTFKFNNKKILAISVTDSNVAIEGPAMKVEDVKSAGLCHVDGTGYVPVLMRVDEKGKAQYAMALAAYMAGKNISIQVRDGLRDSATNICYLYWIGVESNVGP